MPMLVLAATRSFSPSFSTVRLSPLPRPYKTFLAVIPYEAGEPSKLPLMITAQHVLTCAHSQFVYRTRSFGASLTGFLVFAFVGEIFPTHVRSKGVALGLVGLTSTAAWLTMAFVSLQRQCCLG
jgi:hypothetical protein